MPKFHCYISNYDWKMFGYYIGGEICLVNAPDLLQIFQSDSKSQSYSVEKGLRYGKKKQEFCAITGFHTSEHFFKFWGWSQYFLDLLNILLNQNVLLPRLQKFEGWSVTKVVVSLVKPPHFQSAEWLMTRFIHSNWLDFLLHFDTRI